MGKDTTTDGEHRADDDRGYGVKAAEKKVARKKAAKKTTRKKTTRKKAATSKKKAATASNQAKAGKPATLTESAVVTAPQQPAFTPPSDDTGSGGGAMRGIVGLWGPLAIIVLLVVVSRLGDEEAVESGDRGMAGLSAPLETAGRVARDVVDDVQDALTGGDPRAAVVLDAGAAGQGSSGSTSGDLAAAFDDAGVTAVPAGPVPAPPQSAAAAADPWAASEQKTVPASVSAIPGALPPSPENPWAPMDGPATAAVPAEPYVQGSAIPPPGAGYGYGAYPPPPRAYPPQPPGYTSAPPPSYGGRPPAYARQPAYGAPPAYSYPPQPYATPEPYPPGYYPPPQ